jgi:hypothetical protein
MRRMVENSPRPSIPRWRSTAFVCGLSLCLSLFLFASGVVVSLFATSGSWARNPNGLRVECQGSFGPAPCVDDYFLPAVSGIIAAILFTLIPAVWGAAKALWLVAPWIAAGTVAGATGGIGARVLAAPE